MQFCQVIGQQKIKDQLTAEVVSGRIPHAQLFVSRPGSGGLPLAMALAQFINCEQRGARDSCGECGSCRKSAQLVHPDIHFSFPVISSKSGKPSVSTDHLKAWREAVLSTPYMSEYDWLQFIGAANKQGNITAEECRQIIRQLQLKSFEGTFKVQIIWMVEALGSQGNILLKLLEEPPPQTIIILIAESQDLILNTILSRTQLKVLEDLSAEEISTALVAREEADPERAGQIAFLADGNYHRALELSRKTSQDMFKWLDTWVSAAMNSNVNDLLDFNAFLHSEGREKVKHFLDYVLHFLRECLALRFRVGSEVRLGLKEKSLAQRIWKFADLDRISRFIALVEEKHYHVERNVNAKYILLDLGINMRRILRGEE